MKSVLWAAMLTFAGCQATFASWNAGLPDAVFRLPAGAWASGMGGAVSADPDFMLAWYNPSQLPHLRDSRASVGAGLRSLGRTESWASYDFRVPPRVGMGLAFVYRGDPFLNLYDGYYSGGDVVEERSLNSAAWSAVSLKIGAGYLVSRKLSLGGSISINNQKLPTSPDSESMVHHSSVTSIGALDIAVSYKAASDLILSASIKNLLSRNAWTIESHEDAFGAVIEEIVPPIFVLASSHKIKLLERDFTWNADAAFFLIDGEGAYIGRPTMAAAAGARWKFTDDITLRAGLADMEFSGDLWRDGERFRDSFSPRFTAGFSYTLPWINQAAIFNYALMTDRIWAGVDQQFDITVSF